MTEPWTMANDSHLMIHIYDLMMIMKYRYSHNHHMRNGSAINIPKIRPIEQFDQEKIQNLEKRWPKNK